MIPTIAHAMPVRLRGPWCRYIATVLHQYSEWLDSEGLIRGENGGDVRAHDALVGQFISERPENYSPRIPADSS